VYQRYAVWLAEQGRRGDSIDIFKTALSLEPAKTREYIAAMVLAGLADEEIRATLPERTDSYSIFANYLEKTGKDVMASEAYMTALSYTRGAKQPSAEPFHAAYHFYMRKQLFPSAAAVMEKAAELFPYDPVVSLRLAEVYEKEDLKDKALEQYHKVAVMEPKNESVKKKIQELQ
jgi:tetratricopeptide (TPR) repeat protein